MQKQNPLLRIWGWGKDEHGRLIGAVISALIAVVLGMLPYFAAAQVIIGMLAGEKDLSFYLPWLGLGLAGYAARTLLLKWYTKTGHGGGRFWTGYMLRFNTVYIVHKHCSPIK